MASREIYPPIIDSYMPAFNKDGNCRVYFSLSKFNGGADIKTVHVSVMKQNNGLSVINPVDDTTANENNKNIKVFRKNGSVIINKTFTKEDNNLYYFELEPNDIKDGWQLGWIYKIQMRLSEIKYEGDGSNQSNQLKDNSIHFSEQSTVCVTKAIGNIYLSLAYPFNYYSGEGVNNSNNEELATFNISSLEVVGNIVSEDASEKLYSYQIKLYDDKENLVEDSGKLFSNKYQDSNEFYYYVKKELEDGEQYKFEFYYTTINGYDNYKDPYVKNFIIDQALSGTTVKIISLENIDDISEFDYFGDETIHKEEEEGRIGLKILPINADYDQPWSGNLCIKRASEKDNFEQQTDLKIITIHNDYIKNLDVYYDYTIESGVYYKYGVQEIDKDGFRTVLKVADNPAMRDFEYSFLLGENGQQLKLKFDNTMSSYKIQQLESKLEPIGSKYPIITRNAAVEYRIFPITGLISFQMDENYLFCNKKVIYKYDNVVDLHNNNQVKDRLIGDNHKHNQSFEENSPSWDEKHKFNDTSLSGRQSYLDDTYDYIYERDFRKMVLNFLHDGKPKLFKSPTEGNIIVRLTDINCTPNQSLDRMLYSFTSNGNELAEATMENYLKYGFYEVGTQSTTFATGEVKIGQLLGTFNQNTNIIKEIFDKYAKENINYAGQSKKIQRVFGIRITILDKPLRVLVPQTSGNYVLGNNMQINYNNTGIKTITITNGIYEFDSRIEFKDANAEGIYLLGSADEPDKETNAAIDFFYEILSEPYKPKNYGSKDSVRNIGQIYDSFKPGTNLIYQIQRKYQVESKKYDVYLSRVTSIEIEAAPGAVFFIKDSEDTSEGEYHDINSTGVLNFYNMGDILGIVYVGTRREDGSIDRNETNVLDIMVNYHYVLVKGVYKE